MPRQAIAFSSNEQRSKPLDAARLVNLYPETPPLGARAPSLQVGVSSPIKSVLYGTPGLKVLQTLAASRARAGREALGFFWTLYGQTLYRIDSSGNVVACTGDTIPSGGAAMMSDNGIQLALLVGTALFVVGSTNAIGSFTITGGTFALDTDNITPLNQITDLQVDSVSIIDTGSPITWQDSNEAVAAAVAAAVNSFTSSPEYTATSNGATVIIKASTAGSGPNGFGVVPTSKGNVTFTPPNGGSLSGGSASATTVQSVNNPNVPDAGFSSIDYVDGYIVYTVAVSATANRQWGITALFDATNLNALGFASAESTPSDLLRVLVNYEEAWLFSKSGISVWRDTGASPFPFARIPGAVLEKGCAAALSPAKIDSAVFWLGDDRKVYRASAYQPQRISTHGLEEILRAASTVSDGVGMTYSQEGHDFYVLTLPTLGRTFVWDQATSGWHERQSGTSLAPAPWAPRWLASAFGKVYAGLDSGQLCELDLDTYDEAGMQIRRVAVTPPFYNNGKRQTAPVIEIECEAGVGLSAGQGSIPEWMLRWSDDGGKTWSNERRAPLGLRGDGKMRSLFRRLGIFRQRSYELSISDPVPVAGYGLRFEGMGLAA